MTEAPWLRNEEFAALHKELTACTTQLAMIEVAAVLGAAAIFAWIAVNAEGLVGFAGLVWFAPVVVVLFGMLKALPLRRHIAWLAGEIDTLEREKRASAQSPRHAARRIGRGWTAAAAWLLFLALALFGSCLGFIQFRSECGGPMWNVCGPDDGEDDGAQQQDSLKQGTRLHAARRSSL